MRPARRAWLSWLLALAMSCGDGVSPPGALPDYQPDRSCPASFADCDGDLANGCEAPIGTSPANCGGCGVACPTAPGATALCVAGVCTQACSSVTLGDCDSDGANGCETSLSDDVNNCGVCGNTCEASCWLGACDVVELASGLDVPRYLVLDDTHVFFTQSAGTNLGSNAGSVLRVPKAGGPVVVLATVDDGAPGAIVVDDIHMYWVREATAANDFGDGAIFRAAKDGAEPPLKIADAPGRPASIALDGGTLFWTELGMGAASGTVRRLDLADAEAVPETAASGLMSPRGIVAHGEDLYVTAQGTDDASFLDGQLLRIAKDGTPSTPPTPVAEHVPSPSHIAARGAAVSFCVLGGILSYSTADGALTVVEDNPFDGPYDVAADSTRVYWTTSPAFGASLRAAQLDGSAAQTLASNQTWLWDIVVDDESIYFAAGSPVMQPGSGAVRKLPKP